MKKIIFILMSIACYSNGYAAQSTNFGMTEYVVNSGGNTLNSTASKNDCSVGEAVVGQVYGRNSSVQAGFFNGFFLAPPTVTVTTTPIRTFNGELISEDWVYAAPNPIRGHFANIYWHLAETADTEIKIYTTTNQLVISKRWDSVAAGKNHWRWNVSNLANGVYLMLVKAKN